jgi:hypothetical protein
VKQLTDELQGLQEIKSNQAHTQNLVVVEKTATPMYAKAADNSRVLFQAAAKDEFEFLDGDTEWIHVSISGDARGYLLRSSADVPVKIAARLESPATASAEEKFTGFRMEREETSMFPGDWAALKGKTVKIYMAQPVWQNPKESGAAVRLNYSLVFGSGGGVSGDWTSVTLAERAFTTEDTEETCGLKKEDVESRSCRCASGKRGGLPQKAVHENHGTDLKSLCEHCGKLPSAAKAALNFRELRHS